MCDILMNVGNFFTLLKRWPMNFIFLKTTENSFYELDIMDAYPRKHSMFCEKKRDKDAVLESGGHEGVILIKCQT